MTRLAPFRRINTVVQPSTLLTRYSFHHKYPSRLNSSITHRPNPSPNSRTPYSHNPSIQTPGISPIATTNATPRPIIPPTHGPPTITTNKELHPQAHPHSPTQSVHSQRQCSYEVYKGKAQSLERAAKLGLGFLCMVSARHISATQRNWIQTRFQRYNNELFG